MAIRRTLTLAGLALAGALLAALPAPAYLIILKDGTRIESAEKPVAQGRNYLFHDKLGARKMIAITEVDPAKTEAANKENYRDAYILGDPEPLKKETDDVREGPVPLGVHQAEPQVRHPARRPLAAPGEPRRGAGARRGVERSGRAGRPGNVLDPDRPGRLPPRLRDGLGPRRARHPGRSRGRSASRR